jgi:ribosomal protein L20
MALQEDEKVDQKAQQTRKSRKTKKKRKGRVAKGKGKGEDKAKDPVEDVDAILEEFRSRQAAKRQKELHRRKVAVERIAAAQSYPKLARKWSSFIDIFLERAQIGVDERTLRDSHDGNILGFLLNEEHRVPVEFLEQLADLMDSLAD